MHKDHYQDKEYSRCMQFLYKLVAFKYQVKDCKQGILMGRVHTFLLGKGHNKVAHMDLLDKDVKKLNYL